MFLLSRIKEHHDLTGDNKASVAFGLRSTAGIITGAALIMASWRDEDIATVKYTMPDLSTPSGGKVLDIDLNRWTTFRPVVRRSEASQELTVNRVQSGLITGGAGEVETPSDRATRRGPGNISPGL